MLTVISEIGIIIKNTDSDEVQNINMNKEDFYSQFCYTPKIECDHQCKQISDLFLKLSLDTYHANLIN